MTDIKLDDLMSGDGEAMPEATETQQVEQQPEQSGQLRDESGRFATKAEPTEAVEQQHDTTPTADQMPLHGGVPVKAVQEEREKRQAAQQEAEALRREIAELRGMVQASHQPAQQPQREQQPASIWDDPDAFLKSQIDPVQQSVQDMRETIWELQASQTHGAEVIGAAKKAAEALYGTPEGQALYAQITAKGNPFDNLVQWHKRQQTLSQVGDDPQAWLEAELEKRLSDPAYQAQVLERIRGNAASSTTRSQPTTNIPPSLSRIPSGGNQADDGDMSDGALFSQAMR